MSKDNNKIEKDKQMSQKLTTKEKVVWYGGGGVVITSLSVVLLNTLGYNLGWLSIGLDKIMAKYTTGVETEQGPIYQVSEDKPPMLEPSFLQPVIPSEEKIQVDNVSLMPKEKTLEELTTPIFGLVSSKEMMPLNFSALSIEDNEPVKSPSTEVQPSYKTSTTERKPKTTNNVVNKPVTKIPSCHEQIKQNLKLTPWCQTWEKGLREKSLKERNEAQALATKRAEYHRKWRENEKRKKTTEQRAKSNPVNLMTPIANKPTVKKIPSCQEQHKKGLELSAWCGVNWKPPQAVVKVIKPQHQKLIKPTIQKPDKTKPTMTQAEKDKAYCDTLSKQGKTTTQCRKLGYNLPKKPLNTLTQTQKDKAYCDTLSKQGKTTKACIRLGHHKSTKRAVKPTGTVKKSVKKCSNGVDQLSYAQKQRLVKAGLKVNNCDNGWRPPKGAEKYWTGTSECLNPDGSYMIPNFKCDKWKR